MAFMDLIHCNSGPYAGTCDGSGEGTAGSEDYFVPITMTGQHEPV